MTMISEASAEATSDDSLFSARGVSKAFGHGPGAVHAVNEVSFELKPATITTIVGESGSGKSTMARIVLRLMPATAGSLWFHGKDITNCHGAERAAYWREVQAVFQDPFSSFNQFFTVRKLLNRSLKLIPDASEAAQRMESSLDFVGFKPADVLDKYPHQLSGGQRQRIMIARALMMRPQLLIADEATSMLDASLRVNILNVLKDLRDQLGMTVLFITHDIGQATYLADQVLVMENGLLVESGHAEQVIFSPTHDYTKRLLADVPKLHASAPAPRAAPVQPS